MKFWGVYKDGKRVKRYGVHKTQGRASFAFFAINNFDAGQYYVGGRIEKLLAAMGYTIKQVGESE